MAPCVYEKWTKLQSEQLNNSYMIQKYYDKQTLSYNITMFIQILIKSCHNTAKHAHKVITINTLNF